MVEEAARGEPFVIAKARKPMVKVVPLEQAEAVDTSRRFNFLRNADWTVPDDSDKFMQDETIAMFEGDED